MDLSKALVGDGEAAKETRRFIHCPLVTRGRFEVELSFMSPATSERIARASRKTRYGADRKMQESYVDRSAAARLAVRASVHGWRGLTLGGVAQLAPVKGLTAENVATEVDFTPENAAALIVQSAQFDNWLTVTVLNPAWFEPDALAGLDAGDDGQEADALGETSPPLPNGG